MEEEEVQLNVQDIKAVVDIIDIVSTRGALKGEELQFVGAVRNKYAAFLKQVVDAAEQETDVVEDECEVCKLEE